MSFLGKIENTRETKARNASYYDVLRRFQTPLYDLLIDAAPINSIKKDTLHLSNSKS